MVAKLRYDSFGNHVEGRKAGVNGGNENQGRSVFKEKEDNFECFEAVHRWELLVRQEFLSVLEYGPLARKRLKLVFILMMQLGFAQEHYMEAGVIKNSFNSCLRAQ